MSHVDQTIGTRDVNALIRHGEMCAELEQHGWQVVFSHERDYAYRSFALTDKPAIARALRDACTIQAHALGQGVPAREWPHWLAAINHFGQKNYEAVRLTSVCSPAVEAYLYFDDTQHSRINVAFTCYALS